MESAVNKSGWQHLIVTQDAIQNVGLEYPWAYEDSRVHANITHLMNENTLQRCSVRIGHRTHILEQNNSLAWSTQNTDPKNESGTLSRKKMELTWVYSLTSALQLKYLSEPKTDRTQ